MVGRGFMEPENVTFADILDQVASQHPHKVALKSDSGSFTYAQLRMRVDALASSLLALGLGKGDRIAMLAPNCHQYLELYLVSARTGIVFVPLNTRLTAQELLRILADCQPTAMVVEEEFLDKFESLWPGLNSARLFLHIGKPFRGSLDYEALTQSASSHVEGEATEHDLLCILYTGGTTGFPKGAMISNRNWMANTVNALPVLDIKHDDVNLVMTPLFHTAAVWPVLLHLYLGGTSAITSKLDARSTLEIMERERITFCHPVLSQVVALLEDPAIGQHDLSSLRTIQCTMSLPVPAFQRALQVFGNIVVPGYGLTEAGPMVTLMPRSEMASWEMIGRVPFQQVERYGSSGKALPNVEIKLVDEAGSGVPPGQVGEIVVRSQGVMNGYWNRPEASAEALRSGWLYTGDMARMDEQGFLYFVDRKSGMIKTGGESVYPKEVEDAIASHPAVLEVAVFGVPHPRWGETVKAVVALRQGAVATTAELIDHCRQRIASYKKPTSIEFLDALPRNPSGKVMKAQLRGKYSPGRQSVTKLGG